MKIPQHVAIIMDGNRRWARQQGLKASFGHQQMVEQGIQNIVAAAKKLGVQCLTLWAFSTENWQRDSREVQFLMDLFRQAFSTEAEKLHKEGVRIATIGDLSRFDQDIQDSIQHWVTTTAKNTAITVVFALNYGGRDEILRAIQRVAQTGKHDLTTTKLSEQTFDQYLDTADFPPVELIIRPGGETRLSGFLLWQSNYAELYFTETLMPDFGEAELRKALEEYDARQRNFGQ